MSYLHERVVIVDLNQLAIYKFATNSCLAYFNFFQQFKILPYLKEK